MILPTKKTLFRLLWALIPLGISVLLPAPWNAAWFLVPVLFVALCVYDLIVLGRGLPKEVGLDFTADLPLGKTRTLALVIRRQAKAPHLDLQCGLIFEGPIEPESAKLQRVSSAEAKVELDVLPFDRGGFHIAAVRLQWTTPLGTLARLQTWEIGFEGRVVLDRVGIRELVLPHLGLRTWRSGLRPERYSGDGSEFQSLKEYTPGLDPRGIDWAASARSRSLVWREHRAERNQSIILAMDTGRLMADRIDRLTRFDHAVQSALAFSLAALRAGDRVGLATFDSEPHTWVEPRAGLAQYSALERVASGAQLNPRDTNLARAFEFLLARAPRRALIIFFTEFVDAQSYAIAMDLLARLAKRHLLIHVTFPDGQLMAARDQDHESIVDLHTAAIATRQLEERRRVHGELAVSGVDALEVWPDRVVPGLLDRYFRIKREERIA